MTKLKQKLSKGNKVQKRSKELEAQYRVGKVLPEVVVTPKSSNVSNTIFVDKAKRTATIVAPGVEKTYPIAISLKGTEKSTVSGDNLTPEGTFQLGARESRGGYQDKVYGWRPDAYGGVIYHLYGHDIDGRSIDHRGFGLHGSDNINSPSNYQEGKYGTHGCIAFEKSNLPEVEKILKNAGGSNTFTVVINK